MNPILLDHKYDLRNSNEKLIDTLLCCYPNTLENYYVDLKKRKDCDCNLYNAFMLKSYIDILWRHYVGYDGDDLAEDLTAAELATIKTAAKKLYNSECKDCKSKNETTTVPCNNALFELALGYDGAEYYLIATNPVLFSLNNYTFNWYTFEDVDADLTSDDGTYQLLDTTTINYLNITATILEYSDTTAFRLVVTCPTGEQRELRIAGKNNVDINQLSRFIFYSLDGSIPTFIDDDPIPDLVFSEEQVLKLLNMNPSEYTIDFVYDTIDDHTAGNVLTVDINNLSTIYGFPEDMENHNFIDNILAYITHTPTGITLEQYISVWGIPNPTISATTDICFGSSQTMYCEYGGIAFGTEYDSYESYQWYRGGLPINGATSSSYSTSIAGTYTVKVQKEGFELESDGLTIAALEEYGVEINFDDETYLYESDGVFYASSDNVGEDINATGTLLYSGGLPNNTTYEWVAYTPPTVNLDQYFTNATGEYYVNTILPAQNGGCAAESNHILFSFGIDSYLTIQNIYSSEDVAGDISLTVNGFADHIITLSDLGGGTTRLTVVPSIRTGFVYATEDTTQGEWYKIVTDSYGYVDPTGIVVQTGGLTLDVSENGWYGYKPAANITELVAVSDGIDTTYTHVVADTSFIVPDNITMDLDGVTAACKTTDIGGGIYEIWSYDIDLVDIEKIGEYDSNTFTIDLSLSAPVAYGGSITVTYGFNSGFGSILALVKN